MNQLNIFLLALKILVKKSNSFSWNNMPEYYLSQNLNQNILTHELEFTFYIINRSFSPSVMFKEVTPASLGNLWEVKISRSPKFTELWQLSVLIKVTLIHAKNWYLLLRFYLYTNRKCHVPHSSSHTHKKICCVTFKNALYTAFLFSGWILKMYSQCIFIYNFLLISYII